MIYVYIKFHLKENSAPSMTADFLERMVFTCFLLIKWHSYIPWKGKMGLLFFVEAYVENAC